MGGGGATDAGWGILGIFGGYQGITLNMNLMLRDCVSMQKKSCGIIVSEFLSAQTKKYNLRNTLNLIFQ